jgi:hypothetical protein
VGLSAVASPDPSNPDPRVLLGWKAPLEAGRRLAGRKPAGRSLEWLNAEMASSARKMPISNNTKPKSRSRRRRYALGGATWAMDVKSRSNLDAEPTG